MIVLLLIIIIVLLAPELIGLIVGTTAGLASFYLPYILIAIVVGSITFYLVKKNGLSDEEILHERAKQIIKDKYTTFYVICKSWSLQPSSLDADFSVSTNRLSIAAHTPPYNNQTCHVSYFEWEELKRPKVHAGGGWRNIEDLLTALEIPYTITKSFDESHRQCNNLKEAYAKGKQNFSTIDWYVGNSWDKFGRLFSSGDTVPKIDPLADELVRMLRIQK